MSEDVALTFGAAVTCDDGACGQLVRVVVGSYEYAITHLVVGPEGQEHAGRMVPVDLVDAVTPQGVRLHCTMAQFDALDPLEETEMRTASTVDVESQWAQERTMARLLGPHVDLGMGLRPDRRLVTEDNLQEGQGEIWRGQHVHASDGAIGHVRALLTDPGHRTVTFVLLDEGHLWGQKEVAIPARAMRYVFDDGVHLDLTKREVGDLPPVASGQTA